jgi:hypothetical protein
MVCLAWSRGYTIVIALWALAAPGSTSAQASAPEQAAALAQPVVAQGVSPTAAPAPGPTIDPTTLGAEAAAWQQLRLLQERERRLWLTHDASSFALPGVGIGLGFAVASVLLPIGGILMADANSQYCIGGSSSGGHYDYGCEGRDRRQFAIGTTLLTFGLAGLASAVWGIVRVRQLRKARIRSDQELRSISEARTALENVMGARFAR